METTKATVLFIHGSWHVPEHYVPIRKVFEQAGYESFCPRHASVGKKPPLGLKEDAQVIRDELKRLVDDENKNVVVVAHSYGGVVASEAVDAEFARAFRVGKGLSGGVIGMLFLCSFILPQGQSIGSTFDNNLPPFIELDEETQLCEAANAEQTFFNDLVPGDQKKWANQLLPVPTKTQFTGISQAAYLYHPVTYLYCTDDQALPYEVQQMMVNTANNVGAKIETASCDAGHSPYLSMPEKVLEVVKSLRIYPN